MKLNPMEDIDKVISACGLRSLILPWRMEVASSFLYSPGILRRLIDDLGLETGQLEVLRVAAVLGSYFRWSKYNRRNELARWPGNDSQGVRNQLLDVLTEDWLHLAEQAIEVACERLRFQREPRHITAETVRCAYEGLGRRPHELDVGAMIRDGGPALFSSIADDERVVLATAAEAGAKGCWLDGCELPRWDYQTWSFYVESAAFDHDTLRCSLATKPGRLKFQILHEGVGENGKGSTIDFGVTHLPTIVGHVYQYRHGSSVSRSTTACEKILFRIFDVSGPEEDLAYHYLTGILYTPPFVSGKETASLAKHLEPHCGTRWEQDKGAWGGEGPLLTRWPFVHVPF